MRTWRVGRAGLKTGQQKVGSLIRLLVHCLCQIARLKTILSLRFGSQRRIPKHLFFLVFWVCTADFGFSAGRQKCSDIFRRCLSRKLGSQHQLRIKPYRQYPLFAYPLLRPSRVWSWWCWALSHAGWTCKPSCGWPPNH